MQFYKLFSIILLCAFSVSSVGQTVFYVTPSGAGTESGDSWANASNNLNSMLTAAETDAANSGQSVDVWVAAGTYIPSDCVSCVDADRLTAFTIGQNVQLIGGFNGTETLRVEADPTANVTILSGDIGTAGSTADNSYNVVWCNDCKDQAGIEGFTIRDGYADRSAASGPEERGKSGAGIYLTGQVGRQANLNITRCIIQNNYAEGFGAGIYSNGGFGSGQSLLPVLVYTFKLQEVLPTLILTAQSFLVMLLSLVQILAPTAEECMFKLIVMGLPS